jgi:hypothetical protein
VQVAASWLLRTEREVERVRREVARFVASGVVFKRIAVVAWVVKSVVPLVEREV